MKIAHLCLSNFYIDSVTYQENELVAAHCKMGHEVRVIASTEVFGADRRLTYVAPGRYDGDHGETVIRLPYRRGMPHKVARKLRMHPGVWRELADFAPDMILFHGLAGWEIMTAARYARAHPGVVFYADSHEDFSNSAKTFASRELLHKRFYGPVLRRAQGAADKLLCITLETMDFVHDVYRIPRDRLAFFPLGGQIPDDADYAAQRQAGRARLGVGPQETVFVQSGKFGPLKKLGDSLRAFAAHPDPRLRLVLAGVLDESLRAELEPLIAADPARITFLGWQGPEALSETLCAADVYLQPGAQSATMQNSLCKRCAIVMTDTRTHRAFMDGNGWLIDAADPGAALPDILTAISAGRADLGAMQARSLGIARQKLDYDVMAKDLLKPGSFEQTSLKGSP